MGDKSGVVLSRLQYLIDCKKSRQSIADKINCDVSTITKHYNGDRNITVDYVIKYAKYFNVSADYLLGLSDVPTTDRDLRFVCEYTGLSETAVNKILSLNNSIKQSEESNKFNNIENLIFDLGLYLDIVVYTADYIKYSESLKQKYDEILLYLDNADTSNLIEERNLYRDKKDLSLLRLQESCTDFVKTLCANTLDQIKLAEKRLQQRSEQK